MREVAGTSPVAAGDMEPTPMADHDPAQAADQESESSFVHHRRTQRFLGRDTAYSRRPYGRL
jgi:hypothetical protein